MVTGQRNAYGLDEYVVLYGRARVTEGGAAALLQRLARVYLGPRRALPADAGPPAGLGHPHRRRSDRGHRRRRLTPAPGATRSHVPTAVGCAPGPSLC